MSAPDIGKGDWVECLEPDGVLFQRGRPYRVRAVSAHGACDCITNGSRPWAFAHPGLLLCDAPDPPTPHVGWCCYQFRPIYKPKAEFIETLHAPAPTKETERA